MYRYTYSYNKMKNLKGSEMVTSNRLCTDSNVSGAPLNFCHKNAKKFSSHVSVLSVLTMAIMRICRMVDHCFSGATFFNNYT